MLITAAVALGGGIGGTVWALTSGTPTLPPPPADALGNPLTGFTPTDSVSSVVFSPDGRTLAAGSDDRTIRLWNVADPAHPTPLASRLTGFDGDVSSVVFSPDGHTLAAGSRDDTIRLWNVSDPVHPVPLGSPLSDYPDGVNSVVFSPDGHTLAAGSRDDTIRLWALR